MKKFFRWLFVQVVGLGTKILCKVEKIDLSDVPMKGPYILVCNHIGSFEVPLLLVLLQPRRIIGLAKIETWNNKFMAWIFDLWDSIPLRRGEADMEAIRASLGVLKSGGILAVSPEGTRSRHGKLLKGQPGISLLALKSGVPILPVAHWGIESFTLNLKGFKRTDFHMRIGKPFLLDSKGVKVNGEIRQAMADEIMGQIALLMPEEYHGDYSKIPPTTRYLQFST